MSAAGASTIPHNHTRDTFVYNLHRAGWSPQGIALLIGVSRVRVLQLINRATYRRLVQRQVQV
jgi:hypothetical protein